MKPGQRPFMFNSTIEDALWGGKVVLIVRPNGVIRAIQRHFHVIDIEFIQAVPEKKVRPPLVVLDEWDCQ